MHIHNMNASNTLVSGVREKSRLSLVINMPRRVLPATAAATGKLFRCQVNVCGFIKLIHVQPMIPIQGWRIAETQSHKMIEASIKSRICDTTEKIQLCLGRSIPTKAFSMLANSFARWGIGEQVVNALDERSRGTRMHQATAFGELTTSGVPQMFVATTGVPHAIDSKSTLAQPSRLEQSTKTSAALYHHLSWSFGTWPTKRTLFVRLLASASSFSDTSSGPLPTITRIEFFGRAVRASIAK